MSVADYAVADLLPHSTPMVLLDAVNTVSADAVAARTRPRRDDLLASAAGSGMPAWMGMEYLAQAVAAWSGYHELCRGRSVGPGFLVGTRAFRSSVGLIPWGLPLSITAQRLLEDPAGVSVFEGRVTGEGVAQGGRIKVYLPPDLESYLGDADHD